MPSPSAIPGLQPLLISAPFGNYIQPAGCTPTLGTFTAADRGGRPKALWRCLLTLRYYPRLGAWVNKLGLPNPGVDWYVREVRKGRFRPAEQVVSIHGFCADDWWVLLDKVAATRPLAIELNMSCPNIGHIGWPPELFARAVATGVPVIVKIPPINWETLFDQARAAGVTAFHCCNTLPAPNAHPNRGGGISGKPLMGVALQVIQQIRRRPDFDALTLVGGGGITGPADVDRYADLGVKHVAVGTKLFNPRFLFGHAALATIRRRAETRLGSGA